MVQIIISYLMLFGNNFGRGGSMMIGGMKAISFFKQCSCNNFDRGFIVFIGIFSKEVEVNEVSSGFIDK